MQQSLDNRGGQPDDGEEKAAQARIEGRVLARRILLATLLGAAVFAGLSVYSDVQQLRSKLEAFALDAFAMALLLASGNYLVRFLRWHYYLRLIGVRVPRGESACVFLAGFILTVTPGKVGEVFKSLMLYESRGIAVARTAPVVIAERLTDLTALVVLTAAGSLSFRYGVSITAAGALLAGLLIVACGCRPVGEFFLSLTERMPLTRRITPGLREAYESLSEMTRLFPLLIGTAVATLAWGMECAALLCILRGLGEQALSWQAATFAYSASTIAGAAAMMPGGLGVTEVGMTGLLQALGGEQMTAAVATAATILVRIATLWYAVAVGMAALSVYRLAYRRVGDS
jgi:uncharacterized protein (TIRG00374 family)